MNVPLWEKIPIGQWHDQANQTFSQRTCHSTCPNLLLDAEHWFSTAHFAFLQLISSFTVEQISLVLYLQFFCYQANKKQKTMYCVMLDVLPVHVFSVLSECVFSSSKETDTLCRNNVSPEMMEKLQILKFTFASERTDFIDKWVHTQEEISVPNVFPCCMDDLFTTRQLNTLELLLGSPHA